MTWHIILQDKEGQKYTSSVLDTREQAYSFACDLLSMGDLEILKIVNRHGETIDLDDLNGQRSMAGIAKSGEG